MTRKEEMRLTRTEVIEMMSSTWGPCCVDGIDDGTKGSEWWQLQLLVVQLMTEGMN
jgi:hypothetical protein